MNALQPKNHWTRHMQVRLPHRCDAVETQVIDGEGVLFDRRTGQAHRLNETALHIFESCDGERTTSDLADDLAEQFAVRVDRALVDVELTLAAFARVGLVEARDA